MRAVAVVLLLLSAPAAADKAAEKQALKHYEKGAAHFNKKQYDQAIAEYQKAYELVPKPKLLYNIALAYDEKGDDAKALEYYDQYLAAESTGKVADDARKARAKVVKALEEEKRRRENADDDGDGLVNKADRCPSEAEDRDGIDDGDGCPDLDNDGDGLADDKDRCPKEAEDVDGKEDMDGCPDLDNDLDGVPDTEDKCADVAANSPDGCPEVVKHTKPKGGGGGSALTWVGLGTGVVGVVLIGVGAKFGLDAQAAADDVSSVTGQWTAADEQRVSDGESANSKAILLYTVGSVAVVGGGVLFFVGLKSGKAKREKSVSVVPAVTPSEAGIFVQGSF